MWKMVFTLGGLLGSNRKTDYSGPTRNMYPRTVGSQVRSPKIATSLPIEKARHENGREKNKAFFVIQVVDDSGSTESIHQPLLEALDAFWEALLLSDVRNIALMNTLFLHGTWPWGWQYLSEPGAHRVSSATLKHDHDTTPLFHTIGCAIKLAENARNQMQQYGWDVYVVITLMTDGVETEFNWPIKGSWPLSDNSPNDQNWQRNFQEVCPEVRKRVSAWLESHPRNMLVGVALGEKEDRDALVTMYQQIGLEPQMIIDCEADREELIRVMCRIAQETSGTTQGIAQLQHFHAQGIRA